MLSKEQVEAAARALEHPARSRAAEKAAARLLWLKTQTTRRPGLVVAGGVFFFIIISALRSHG